MWLQSSEERKRKRKVRWTGETGRKAGGGVESEHMGIDIG